MRRRYRTPSLSSKGKDTEGVVEDGGHRTLCRRGSHSRGKPRADLPHVSAMRGTNHARHAPLTPIPSLPFPVLAVSWFANR